MSNQPLRFAAAAMRFQRVLLVTLLATAIGLASSVATGQRPAASTKLPSGDRWLKHLNEDLVPFYTGSDAIGSPRGDFPTFRCDDGSTFDMDNSCNAFANLASPDWNWIKEGIKRDYVRIKSRQVFFYCAAYHMTGEEELLALARDGVDYLCATRFDKDGIPYSYVEGEGDDRSTGPPQLERTSQDLAYALNGLVFYYFLTRDPAVEKHLIRVKNHIFDNYYDARIDMIRWVARDPEGSLSHFRDTQRKELVAQLDQINAYMLLATPYLPEPERARWKKDMIQLCHVMIREFYDQQRGLFWGSVHDDSGPRLGSRHTDFGHTIKTLWMIERVGRLTGNMSLLRFAVPKAPDVLAAAYLQDEQTWASKLDADGEIVRDKEWWIHAELDQAAATWAVHDASVSRYLPQAYDFWFRNFVDPRHGEVWHLLRADGSVEFPKAHLWKNGFHSSEHALVGYITSQELYDEPVTLYFAPVAATMKKDEELIVRPYLYSGEVVSRQPSAFAKVKGHKKLRVQFVNIR